MFTMLWECDFPEVSEIPSWSVSEVSIYSAGAVKRQKMKLGPIQTRIIQHRSFAKRG